MKLPSPRVFWILTIRALRPVVSLMGKNFTPLKRASTPAPDLPSSLVNVKPASCRELDRASFDEGADRIRRGSDGMFDDGARFELLERGMRRRESDRGLNRIGKLSRMGRGEHDAQSIRIDIGKRTRSVRIHHVIELRVHGANDLRNLPVRASRGRKYILIEIGKLVTAGLFERRHYFSHPSGILAEVVIQKAFKV